MKKNDIVRVEITDLGTSGEGIGKVDGYTVFIKDAVIGDVVEAKIMKAKKIFLKRFSLMNTKLWTALLGQLKDTVLNCASIVILMRIVKL